MAEFTAFGRFVWYDLMSPDPESSKRFYTEVLGWGIRVDRPLMGIEGRPPYVMWTAGDTPIAGLVPLSEACCPAEWGRGYQWTGESRGPRLDCAVPRLLGQHLRGASNRAVSEQRMMVNSLVDATRTA